MPKILIGLNFKNSAGYTKFELAATVYGFSTDRNR